MNDGQIFHTGSAPEKLAKLVVNSMSTVQSATVAHMVLVPTVTSASRADPSRT